MKITKKQLAGIYATYAEVDIANAAYAAKVANGGIDVATNTTANAAYAALVANGVEE